MKWWTLAGVAGLSWWFFGNLYEAVVISPNWVVSTPEQIARLNEFYVRTGPTFYFVPLTFLTCALVWILLLVNRDERVRRDYRRAALWALLLTGLNIVIVTTIVIPLFEGDTSGEHMRTLAVTWNGLNVVRMALTATTAVFLFNAFRKLDQ